MSDPLEEAAAITELMLQESLSKRQKVPEKTGLCLECEAPTEGAFCSRECREDFEARERINRIKGIRR
jgi:hypothetical protein